ncbi:MAG: ribonuclease Z [Acidobacteriota bacterium]|nr:ribonuclease Z [Acidobacteriota bacterium]
MIYDIYRMKITILGSGTSVPHPKRSGSAYWVETENGSMLIDCAPSAIHRMAEEGLDWANLDTIWISHLHLDHAGGLAPFLFGMKYAPQTQRRTKPLNIFGAKGLGNWFRQIDDAGNYRLLEQPFPIELVEVEPLKEFPICDGLTAVSFDTPHTPESRAIHLRDTSGKTLVFSADTGFTKTLGSFAKNVDLFLLECSFVRDKPVDGHLQLDEAIYLARYSGARTTVLTHLYPEWDEVDFEEEVARLAEGTNIVQAFDGMTLTIDH